MAEGFRTWLRTWEEFHLVAEEYRALADERVLVLDNFSGHGKRSGLDLGQIQADGAWLFRVRDRKVTQMARNAGSAYALLASSASVSRSRASMVTESPWSRTSSAARNAASYDANAGVELARLCPSSAASVQRY
jgi:hypothetical protein